jgi:UDP-3-O-[3-hydroxymyristoyl] glucosamine N-acyltransferase
MKYTEEERLEFARKHIGTNPGDNVYGDHVVIHHTAIIGEDGFGFVRDEKRKLVTMPHAGRVVIGHNVLIKAFVTVDRGVVEDTVLGNGNRIDHHCHIAHNVKIGDHNTFANGCIIEGSCIVGDYNTFGAGVIVQTKVKIGSHCKFGSGTVVVKDVEDNSVMVGNPARKLEKK